MEIVFFLLKKLCLKIFVNNYKYSLQITTVFLCIDLYISFNQMLSSAHQNLLDAHLLNKGLP